MSWKQACRDFPGRIAQATSARWVYHNEYVLPCGLYLEATKEEIVSAGIQDFRWTKLAG